MSNLQSVIESYGVHPELGKEANGFWIEQSPYELAAFLEAIEPLGIKTVLEIGTGHKAGLARFMSEFLGWKVVSVDIHQPFVKAPLVDLRISATHIDFPNTRFDLVIIDADHAYESVKADYAHYAPYADKVVMFHDIAGLRGCEGSAKFWGEIAFIIGGELPIGYHTIFDPNEGSRCGIGWIDVQAAKVPTDAPVKVTLGEGKSYLGNFEDAPEDVKDQLRSVATTILDKVNGTAEVVEPPAEEAPKTATSRKGRKPRARLQ